MKLGNLRFARWLAPLLSMTLFGCVASHELVAGADDLLAPVDRRGLNASQQHDAAFALGGVQLAEQTAWISRFRLGGYGCVRGASRFVEQLAPVRPQLGSTIRYEHPIGGGTLHEWYKHASAGLEQGFTLDQPPCEGPGAAARLEITVTGLRAVPLLTRKSIAANYAVSTSADILLLEDSGEAGLRYSDARAEDAAGHALPLAVEALDDRIILTLELDGAVFPVTVDPLIATQQGPELLGSEGATGDYFGFSLALAGDAALIGSPGHRVSNNSDQGAIYAFQRNASVWAESEPALAAADGAVGDHFGFSLAMSKDTVVVGAPGHQVGAQPDQGAAYVFVRDGAGWVQQGEPLHAVDGRAADAFGSAVAISGDTIIVGAPNYDFDSKADQGAAYVFVRDKAEWMQQGPALLAEDGRAGDTFATSVALSDDSALVSAPVHQVGINPYQGAAYVFVRREGSWSQQGGDLVAPDGGPFDQLGPCALSGDTLLLGVPFHTPAGLSAQGAAYVFRRAGETWLQQGPAWVAPDGGAHDLFGSSVALSGEVALVAAPGHFVEPNGYRGAGYLFARSEEEWTQQGPELVVRGGAPKELLASSLALSSDSALLGAPFHQVTVDPEQGAAYAFSLAAGNFPSLNPCDGGRGGVMPCASSLRANGGCACSVTGRTKSKLDWPSWLGVAVVLSRRRGERTRASRHARKL